MHIETDEKDTQNQTSVFETVHDMDLEALIDNELVASRKDIVLSAIATDPRLQARYVQLCRQKDLLQLWWKTNSHNT